MTRPTTARFIGCAAFALLAATSGCTAEPAAGPAVAGRLAVSVGALSLPGVTDARYELTVTNAAGGAGDTVWTRELTSSQYGDGAGSVSYVGTCDAGVAGGVNSVTLELLALYDGATEIPAATYLNPTPVTRDAVCVADTDTRVTFDLTVARSATQGFFDVAVTFDDIFCSAKLDCLDDDGAELALLHNPTNGGARDLTAVLAFACTAAPSGDTYLYMDDPVVTCTGLPGQPITISAASLGNVDLDAAPTTNPADYLFAAAVYRGDEGLAAKSYWNISLGLDREAFDGLGTCTLTSRATAATAAWPQEAEGFAIPAGTVYPVVEWSVALNAAGARTCTTHEVNAAGSGVATTYRGYLPAPNTFTWDAGPVRFDHRYHRGGALLSKAGTPPAPAYPANGLMLHVDAAVNATGVSLDPTGDVPDVMTMAHVNTGVKYWTSDPPGGAPGYMKWNADNRWQSPSYTVCGWFYKRSDTRQLLWSQYIPTGQAKFNWAADPNREYHNNSVATGAVDFNGGPWYALDAWHFHAMTYDNQGLLTISVDGRPAPVALWNYVNGQASVATSVALASRNDDFASERFYGHVAQAWYYDRALSGDELAGIYQATKARYGVDRVYRHAPLYPVDGLMLHVDAAVNSTGQSLDASGDMPDLMTMTHVDSGVKYWSSGASGAGGYMRWNADPRWGPSGSFTVAGWFYKRTDGRQALWSQFIGGTGSKFNWMADPNREYHNNMTSSGGLDYNGGPWYGLNAWHFHAMTYVNRGQLKISVDGNAHAVAVANYGTSQANLYTSVALGSRNDSFEHFDGFVAQAWYYGRALTDQELADLYATTKARYGVNRVYSHAAP